MKTFFTLSFFALMFSLSAHNASAAALSIPTVKAFFREESIGIGYTLVTAGDECRLGVPAHAFGDATEAAVILRHIKKSKMKETFGENVSLSPLFRYRVKEPATLTAPLWISIAWRKTTEETYVLKEWNAETATWDTLSSTIDEESERVQAQVSHQSGIVGIFEQDREEITTHSGKASWYHGNSMYGYGSAMNIFPIGTTVRVTNIANGKQVETKIVSTGPFVEGRIIDLSKDAFNAISKTSVGVIDVIVEEVKE